VGSEYTKIKTAATRRAIDMWKERAKTETSRFHSWTLALVAQLIVSTGRRRMFLVIPVVLALSLNFAVFELVILILIGFFIAKLHCYRFVNSMMKLMPFGK